MLLTQQITRVTGSPVNNAAFKTIFDLPSGFRVHDLQLLVTLAAGQSLGGVEAGTTAVLSTIRLKIGTRKQRELSWLETEKVQSLVGVTSSNNVPGQTAIVPIQFTQGSRKEYLTATRFALDLPQGILAQLEVEGPSLGTAPALTLRAGLQDIEEVRDRLNLVQGLPLLEKYYVRSPAVTPNIEDGWIEGRQSLISFGDPTGATITALEIFKNGRQIFQATKAENDERLSRFGMFPVIGSFDVVPDWLDDPGDTWFFRQSDKIKVNLTYSAAATGTVKIINTVYNVMD